MFSRGANQAREPGIEQGESIWQDPNSRKVRTAAMHLIASNASLYLSLLAVMPSDQLMPSGPCVSTAGSLHRAWETTR